MKTMEREKLMAFAHGLNRSEFHGLMAEVFLQGYLRSKGTFVGLTGDEMSQIFHTDRRENQGKRCGG